MTAALALQVATYLLVGDGLAALSLAGLLGPAGLAAVVAAIVPSLWREALARRVTTRGLPTALGVALGLAWVGDLVYLAETALDAFVHLLLFLVVARLYTLRAPSDTRVAAFLTFFMLVAAGGSAFGVGFLAVFVGFVLLVTVTLLLQHVLAEAEPSPQRAVVGMPLHGGRLAPLVALAAAAAVGTFVVTAALFFVIPRVGLAALPFRGKLGPLVTGFTERVELGAYGQIETDASTAFRVHIPEGLGGPDDWPDLRWRGIVFDEFDGRAWTVGRPERVTLRRLLPDFRLGRFTGQGRILWQEVYLEPIGTEVIFAAPRILRLEARTTEVTVDDMGSVAIASPAARLHYRVESELPAPPPPALPDRWGFARPEDPRYARYLQLPDLSPRVRGLARTLAEGSPTPYEAARRLTAHLAREFTYTLALPRRTSLPPLDEFLFERRAGNCEYFAAALAVMLRSLGIPARVAGGFQRGEWNPYGRYFTVRMQDAHAWVEAYFPSAGWLSLDPSPRAAAGPGRSLWALQLDALRMRWYRYVVNWSLRDQVDVVVTVRRQTGTWAQRLARFRPGDALPPGAWTAAALALGVAGLAAARWYRRRPASTAAAAARPPAFYRQALRRLARRGWRPGPGETAREFRRRVEGGAPWAAAPLDVLTRAYERARFSEAVLEPEERQEVAAALGALRRGPGREGTGPAPGT